MNGARKKNQPKQGYPSAKSGPKPGISEGGPNYTMQLPRTQPRDRSLGMRRVKACAQKKGL